MLTPGETYMNLIFKRLAALAAVMLLIPGLAMAQKGSPTGFLGYSPLVTPPPGQIIPNLPPSPTLSVSTVPSDGDTNPHGVAFVPSGFATGGVLNAGDALVANFSNHNSVSANGKTVVRITPSGQFSLFWQGTPTTSLRIGVTAVATLKAGLVLVGNTPSPAGTFSAAQAGGLFVLDKNGHQVQYINGSTYSLKGPWGLAVKDSGSTASIFVSDVLNGTITRLDVTVGSTITVNHAYVIATGYNYYAAPKPTFGLGPAGLAYDPVADVLYVSATANNALYTVSSASTTTSSVYRGTAIYSDKLHFHGPIGMLLAPNGDVVVSHGDGLNPAASNPSELTEMYLGSGTWHYLAQYSIDSSLGAPFGIALDTSSSPWRLAAVDTLTNKLYIYNVNVGP